MFVWVTLFTSAVDGKTSVLGVAGSLEETKGWCTDSPGTVWTVKRSMALNTDDLEKLLAG